MKNKNKFNIILTSSLVAVIAFGITLTMCSEPAEAQIQSYSAFSKSTVNEITVHQKDDENVLKTSTTSSKKTSVSASSDSSKLSSGKEDSEDKKADSSKNTAAKTSSKPSFKYTYVSARNVRAYPLSVSSIKLVWTAEKNREYNIEVSTEAPYVENIDFVFKEKGLCYITGLRENSEYEIKVTPIIKKNEKKTKKAVSGCAVAQTKAAGDVIEEFDYEDGWTSCFAGERASGLTAMPSSGAIYGSKVDEVTGTGIRRFENGDYACAMGEYYGECGDRFLVELENGIQFTVRICDSKGWADDADGDGEPDGRFHWFGGTGNGKCVIEFIYDDANFPSCVAFSGSWGFYNWNGLNLCSDIKQIQKLATW